MMSFWGKMRRTLALLIKMNILKTVYVNYKMLPIRQAIHLPILLFGKVVLHCLSGRIIIDAPITFGMIKIGYRWHDLFPLSYLPTQLYVSGTLSFKGSCTISGGVGLFIQNRAAKMAIGNNSTIGGGTLVKSVYSLSIGNYTRITSNCTIMDSNMHYVKDIESGFIAKAWGKIEIGNYCWINQGSTITKGTVIPDFSIVARGSYLNKDYSLKGPNAFIVGCPAIIKNNKLQRIFNTIKEEELSRFFRANIDSLSYDDGQGLFNESL